MMRGSELIRHFHRATQRELSLPEGRGQHREHPVPLKKHAQNLDDHLLRGDPEPDSERIPGIGADFHKIPVPGLPRMHKMQMFMNLGDLMFQVEIF